MRYYYFSNDCVTLHDQMLCIICMAVNDDTFNANKLYVMLCYVMLCYVMLCLNMLCYTDLFEEFLHIRNVKNTHNIFSVSLYPILFSSLHKVLAYSYLVIHRDSFLFTKINCVQTDIYNAVFKSYYQWSIV